mmetsp:Transcript_113888/g.328921  ORF Transcript_113888/g.328921 Transcript_113888/m.328921 type:complete len:212 (+) Transcript_113888:876-1511(+)
MRCDNSSASCCCNCRMPSTPRAARLSLSRFRASKRLCIFVKSTPLCSNCRCKSNTCSPFSSNRVLASVAFTSCPAISSRKILISVSFSWICSSRPPHLALIVKSSSCNSSTCFACSSALRFSPATARSNFSTFSSWSAGRRSAKLRSSNEMRSCSSLASVACCSIELSSFARSCCITANSWSFCWHARRSAINAACSSEASALSGDAFPRN